MRLSLLFFLMLRPPLRSTLFPYTTLFRSFEDILLAGLAEDGGLFVPESLPKLDPATLRGLAGLSYAELCARIERSEEHTSELQSRFDLVCRLLLEKNNQHLLAQSLEVDVG